MFILGRTVNETECSIIGNIFRNERHFTDWKCVQNFLQKKNKPVNLTFHTVTTVKTVKTFIYRTILFFDF